MRCSSGNIVTLNSLQGKILQIIGYNFCHMGFLKVKTSSFKYIILLYLVWVIPNKVISCMCLKIWKVGKSHKLCVLKSYCHISLILKLASFTCLMSLTSACSWWHPLTTDALHLLSFRFYFTCTDLVLTILNVINSVEFHACFILPQLIAF